MTIDDIVLLRTKDVAAADFIENVLRSPYYEGYKTLKKTIDSWNHEINNSPIMITSDKDDKAFERASKYLMELKFYYEQLDYMRTKLLPKEIEEVEAESTTLLDEARMKMKDKKRNYEV